MRGRRIQSKCRETFLTTRLVTFASEPLTPGYERLASYRILHLSQQGVYSQYHLWESSCGYPDEEESLVFMSARSRPASAWKKP